MRKLLAATALVSTVSLASFAIAQTKPLDPNAQYDPSLMTQMQAEPTLPVEPTPDARALASDQDVGEARRAYRNACEQHQSPGYCDCVTAGVAQALMPQEVRIAARTIGERINAQGDAMIASESDRMVGIDNSAERIEHVEAHYASACAQFRR
jgi:hypothetical protein